MNLMNPNGVSIGELAMRSAAVNVPLAASIVLAAAGVYAVMHSPDNKKRCFLRAAAEGEMPEAELLAFIDADNPVERAIDRLRDSGLDESLRKTIRNALAAAL